MNFDQNFIFGRCWNFFCESFEIADRVSRAVEANYCLRHGEKLCMQLALLFLLVVYEKNSER